MSNICTITNNNFLNDLINLEQSLDTASSRLNELYSLMSSKDQWTPLFVNQTSPINGINYLLVSTHGYYKDNSVGFQDFITINNPSFRSWTVSAASMTTDWVLNKSYMSYTIDKGLLLWYKNITSTSSTEFGDILFDSNENIKLIRNRSEIPNNILDLNYMIWVPDGDVFDYYLNNSERVEHSGRNPIPPRTFCSAPLYRYYKLIYHLLTIDHIKSFNYRNTKVSRIYKNIAKHLSSSPFIDEDSLSYMGSVAARDGWDSIRNRIRAWFNSIDSYEKLLNDIVTDLINFLPNTINNLSENRQSEIRNNLSNNLCLRKKDLYKKLISKYGLFLKLNNGGSITYNRILPHGASVAISQIGNYWLNKNMSDNTVAYANQTINLPGLELATNFTEKKSHIRLRADFDPNHIVNETIYLYNATKPLIKNLDIDIILDKSTNNPFFIDSENNNQHIFYWYDGSTDIIEFSMKLDYIKDISRLAEDPFKPSDIFIEESYVNCTWEQVSGPPLKFINTNKVPQGTRIGTDLGNGSSVRYGEDSFTGTKAYVYPSSSGRYQIKCSINSLYGNFTVIKTFFVVFGGFVTQNGSSRSGPTLYGKYYVGSNSINFPIAFTGRIIYGTNPNGPSGSADLLISPDTNQINRKNNILNRLNSKNIKVNIPELQKIAIHRNGLFWPINTNLMVHNKGVRASSFDILSGNTYKFSFDPSGVINLANTLNGQLSIEYSYASDVYLKLDSIILENIRNNADQSCKTCLSMYHPKFFGRDSINFIREGENITRAPSVTYVRGGYGDNGFRFEAYDVDQTNNIIKLSSKNYNLPNISTDYTPNIISYGNYSNDIKSSIGLNIPDHPANSVLPSVTGYKLDYTSNNTDPNNPIYKQCIEENIQNNNGINFTKGVFHPSSGWIPYNSPLYNDVKNLSSVLKFNPGARDSFNFIGPSINNLVNDGFILINGIEYILPKQYASAIDLSISEGARWIPFCRGCSDKPPSEPPEWKWKNQFHREYADQQPPSYSAHTHGYRILEGGSPKVAEKLITSSEDKIMDEFGTQTANILYQSKLMNQISYRFPVSGPYYPINPIPSYVIEAVTGAGSAQASEDLPQWSGIRNPRVLDFKIKDIEVKLNFLNYVNTKDISVSFELSQCPEEKDRVSGSLRAKNPFKNQLSFNGYHLPNNLNQQWIHNDALTYDGITSTSSLSIFNNSFISGYLTSLVNINSMQRSNDDMRLYLLNQEYIQNNMYNFSITFSDSSNKFNVLSDYSLINTSGINTEQFIVQNSQTIKPTIAATGFSDVDCSLFHNILLNNKLYITNNTFNKFQNQLLFKEPAPPCPRGGRVSDTRNSGKSGFICNITIFDEHDDMNPIDNIYDPQSFTNFYSFDKTINSSKFTNSLCNWELFLHIGNVHKPVTSLISSMDSYSNSDPLSLIEYGSKPKYPGYSFIADLYDKKHLLPFVNLNAPYSFFQTSNLCEDPSNQSIGKRLIKVNSKFPTEIIVAIIAATAGLSAAGGMIGVLSGLGGYDMATSLLYQSIVQFWNQARQLETREAIRRNIYQPTYDNYPFGSPEKILINFSKDNIFWYKGEASIFKYRHTPVLIPNTYNYMKLSPLVCPSLSNFKYEIINSIEDIIDPIFITNTTLDNCETDDGNSTLRGLTVSTTINGITKQTILQENDIVKVSFGINANNDCNSEIYLVKQNDWISLKDNPNALKASNKYIQFNNILNYKQRNDLLNIFNANLADNKIIKIKNKILYDLVDVNDSININSDTSIIGTNTVLAKALIIMNRELYTVLVMRNPIVGDYISPKKCIVVFNSQNSFNREISSPGSNIVPLSNNPFVKDVLKLEIPEVLETTNSVGSYGEGINSVNKNIFYYKSLQNNLESINTIFNNSYTDYIRYNKIFINGLNLTPAEGTIGYNYSITSVPTLINNITQYIASTGNITDPSGNIPDNSSSEIDAIEKILSDYDSMVHNNIKLNGSIMYLKNISTDSISNFGQIKVEEDHVIRDTTQAMVGINNITQNSPDFIAIVNRLNTIDSIEEDPILENYIGKPENTDNIIFSKKLKYIFAHYNNLDDISSLSQLEAKNKTEYAIRVFSKERDDIIKLLDSICDKKYVSIEFKNPTRTPITNKEILTENYDYISFRDGSGIRKNDTIKKITRSYGLKDISYGILPQKIARIRFVPNIFSSSILSSITVLNVEYTDSDHYWINLDPHQSVTIAEELRPKVLNSIIYRCAPVNLSGPASLQPENNVCAGHATNTTSGDITFTKIGTEYKYTISPQIIQANKQLIETRVNNAFPIVWQKQLIERRYQLNATDSINRTFNRNELLITVIEEYEILLAPHEINPTTITLTDADTVKLTPLSNPLCPDSSPGGLGLLRSGAQSRAESSLKIYNICNLDNINNLKVQIRKIPRLIRGIDLLATINRYGYPNTYRPQIGGSLLDPLDSIQPAVLNNNFYYWKCYEKNNNNQLILTSTPPFFQLMNEMIYRAFYGSSDKIENKYTELLSQFAWELIPYEYFTKPRPAPQQPPMGDDATQL